eukprot:g1144.t1
MPDPVEHVSCVSESSADPAHTRLVAEIGRLEKHLIEMKELIVKHHEQTQQQCCLHRQNTIPSSWNSRDAIPSIYEKLKQRYGSHDEQETVSGELVSQQLSESAKMKLMCYDFKITSPFEEQETEEEELQSNSKSWWRSCWDCSILPEDDDENLDMETHRKYKQKKNPSPAAPGPIAEGLEEESVKIPSIMTGKDQEVPFSSVIIQKTENISERNVNKKGLKFYSESSSSNSETDSDVSEEESLWKSIFRPFRMLLWDVIYPTSTFRTRWDLYMLVLFVYVCVISPYTICFGIEAPLSSPLGVLDMLVNVSFGFDIFLNFRTAYIDENNRPILDRRKIAAAYSKSWLLIDTVSILPLDSLVTNKSLGFFKLFKATRIVKIVKILRLLKIVKMLRIVKIPTQLRHLETMFNRGVLRLITFMSAAILVTHLCACFFYYASYLEGFDPDTWVWISNLEASSNFDKYVTALYWSMSTLTTVGYGDVIPGNSTEKIMSMIGMVIGVTVFAYFMGSMSSMMSSLNNTNTRITRKTIALEEFLKKRKVPSNLAERVRTFFQHILSRQIVVDETSIINELSLPLRTELTLYLYRDILAGVPFFRGKDPQFIVRVVPLLKLEYYGPGEVVIRQGDPGDVMYFVSHGHLEVRAYYEESDDKDLLLQSGDQSFNLMKASEIGMARASKMKRIASHVNTHDLENAWKSVGLFGTSESYRRIGKLKKGEYFGEYSCLLGEYRTATVVAEDYCELYSLSRSDLDSILDEMPELGKEFLKMVEVYVEAGYGEEYLNPVLKANANTIKPEAESKEDVNPISTNPSIDKKSFGRKSLFVRMINEEQIERTYSGEVGTLEDHSKEKINCRVAVLGASGYTGAEVARLLAQHPKFRISALTADRQAGKTFSTVFPHLTMLDNLPELVKVEDVNFDEIDSVFCCLPHGTTQSIIASIPHHVKIVDLSADFRLRNPVLYQEWYGKEHAALDLQAEAVYGLTEVNRSQIRNARIIANPGCYPTSCLLPLIPVLRAGLIDSDSIIIDSKSGVSGAGRAPGESKLFCEVADGLHPYGIANHRHLPEIEQELSDAAGGAINVTFTPHLIPMSRGMLSTIYVQTSPGVDADALRMAIANFYINEQFVKVLDEGIMPQTRHVRGSNFNLINVFDDRIAGRAVIVSVIDNLVKGASGQALQNMNLIMDEKETTGLLQQPMFP